jgi:hypothetical protein
MDRDLMVQTCKAHPRRQNHILHEIETEVLTLTLNSARSACSASRLIEQMRRINDSSGDYMI